ncbi:MAG: hypothetical protein KC940_07665 [Candidatus Omnitrophica bacterium]|nr:hypothetical protein [Candidatus Omnitrophota bacterium]
MERNLAEILQSRILERSQVDISIDPEDEPVGCIIHLGRTVSSGDTLKWLSEWGIDSPTAKDPGPEGFLLTAREAKGGWRILAVGVDSRGLLYAVGELLRRFTYAPESLEIEPPTIRSAPAYRWRGSSANQGGTMREVTGARSWTEEERRKVMFDHLFAGANTLYAGGGDAEWLKTFDIKIEQGCRPNQLSGSHPEWRRDGTERGPYVCPSIPEARAALLEYWEKEFKEAGPKDVLRFFSGDPGGCRCDLCMPWGKTFVHLCEELSEIWLKHHPGTEIEICNQDLTNEGDLEIFKYLNEKPRTWLTSLSYGPGSNAMSDYFRDELREDLFTYPAQGPINRYLAYTLHQLPINQTIVHYSDITHWISAQYEIDNPEPHLVRVYGRRTFHQRPRDFYRIFHDIMPFSEGDIIYSEGYHDELHQYLWNRMLWAPHRSLDDLMMEYATYHFGKAAAPEMVQASYQLEENLQAPLAANEGIERYYRLVHSAGDKIPENLMVGDHRWRAHLQKAALDKYFQEKLRRESDLQQRATQALELGLNPEKMKEALSNADEILAEPIETQTMLDLLQEARIAGEETDHLFGIRNVGYFNREIDLTGLGWFKQQVKDLAKISDPDERVENMKELLMYEYPGDGGFYDNAGVEGKQPHLVLGESLSNPAQFAKMLDPNNRPSANTFAYNMEGPVEFQYQNLDRDSSYRVKLTLVGVRMPPAMAKQFGVEGDLKLSQDILVDGEPVAEDLPIPQYTARQFEFDIPPQATADGNLRLTIKGIETPGGFSASVVSEVWLMKRED